MRRKKCSGASSRPNVYTYTRLDERKQHLKYYVHVLSKHLSRLFSSFRGELFDKQKVSKQCTMRIFNENQTMSCHARRVVMDGVTRAVVT